MFSLHIRLTFAFLLLIAFIDSRQIQVPAVKLLAKKSIKIGKQEQINLPDFNFQYVRERKVYLANNELAPFPYCRQNKPEIQFDVRDYFTITPGKQRPLVLYKFEDIQYSQFLLDTFLNQNRLYFIFQDGSAGTVSINKEQLTFQNYKLEMIKNLQQNAELQPGYFIKVGSDVIFINNKFAVLVNSEGSTKISGYEGGKDFVNSVSIEDSFIAVAYEQTGIVFYRLTQSKTLEKIFSMTPSQISPDGNIQIADLAYYREKKSLLILDEDEGIESFSVEVASNNELKISTGPILLKREGCQMMKLTGNSLFLVCGNIYQVQLQNWPKVQEKTIDHPNIKIRQIYAESPLVAFVGRNIFKLLYFNKFVSYFEDEVMDKLLFDKDIFISSNQYGILVGKYSIVQPYITCQVFDENLIGSHALVYKTIAQCNREFFTKNNINSESLGEFTGEDTCIYTVEQSLYVWKSGKIRKVPIIIVSILLLCAILAVAGIYIYKKISIKRYQQQLAGYQQITSNADVQKHQQLIQQVPETGNNKSGASNKAEEDEVVPESRPEDIEMQNHDIQ